LVLAEPICLGDSTIEALSSAGCSVILSSWRIAKGGNRAGAFCPLVPLPQKSRHGSPAQLPAWLQAATGSDRPVPLLYDTKSGHSGGRPINKIIEENTDIPSFLFW
jgi:hypothetical protein